MAKKNYCFGQKRDLTHGGNAKCKNMNEQHKRVEKSLHPKEDHALKYGYVR